MPIKPVAVVHSQRRVPVPLRGSLNKEVARRTKFGVIEHVEQLTPPPVEGKLMVSKESAWIPTIRILAIVASTKRLRN
jgi:hypothetical protein